MGSIEVEPSTISYEQLFRLSATTKGVSSLGTPWTGQNFYQTFYNYCPLPMGISQACPDDMLNLDCNIAASRYFLRAPEDIKNRTSSSMGAPIDCIREWLKCYKESTRLNHPCSFEYISQCASNRVNWLCCTIYPIEDPTRENKTVFAYIINDITDKKLMQLETERLQKKLENLIDNIEATIFEIDTQTSKFSFINKQAETTFGIKKESWIGADYSTFFSQYIHTKDRMKLPSIESVVPKQKTESFFRMTLPHDTQFKEKTCWAKMTLTISDTDPTTVVGILVPITDSMKLKELESQEGIRSDVKPVVAKFKQELRAPLNHLMGLLGSLAETSLNSRQQEIVQVSLDCVNSINCSLKIPSWQQKVELGEIQMENTPFDLRKIIDESTTIASLNAADRDYQMVVDYPSNMESRFLGDPNHMRLFMLKLLQSAVNHTALSGKFQGDKDISLSIRADPPLVNLQLAYPTLKTPPTSPTTSSLPNVEFLRKVVARMGGEMEIQLENLCDVSNLSTVQIHLPLVSLSRINNSHLSFLPNSPSKNQLSPVSPSSPSVVITTSPPQQSPPSSRTVLLTTPDAPLQKQLQLWGFQVVSPDTSPNLFQEIATEKVKVDAIIKNNRSATNNNDHTVSEQTINKIVSSKDVPIIKIHPLSKRPVHEDYHHDVMTSDHLTLHQHHNNNGTTVHLSLPWSLFKLNQALQCAFRGDFCNSASHPSSPVSSPVLNDSPTISTKRKREVIENSTSAQKVLLIDNNLISRKSTSMILEKQGFAVKSLECLGDFQEDSVKEFARAAFSQSSYQMVLLNMFISPNVNSLIREMKQIDSSVIIVGYSPVPFNNQYCQTIGIEVCITKPFKSNSFKQVYDNFIAKRSEKQQRVAF